MVQGWRKPICYFTPTLIDAKISSVYGSDLQRHPAPAPAFGEQAKAKPKIRDTNSTHVFSAADLWQKPPLLS